MDTGALADRQTDAANRYLDLLAKAVCRYGMDATLRPVEMARRTGAARTIGVAVERALAKRSLALCRKVPSDLALREVGREIPVLAETAVGLKRLANVRACIEATLRDGVPGDLLEAGVWRGGTVIYMCGVLAAHGAERTVWAADSFEGLPAPDVQNYPQDADMRLHEIDEMAVGEHTVRAALERYGLLSDNVRFLKGWFKDTLPGAPIERLSVLRVDADMYESTTQVLEALYDRVSPGGFVIIDDYGCFPACRAAVDDFRSARGIAEPLVEIDWTGVFWRTPM